MTWPMRRPKRHPDSCFISLDISRPWVIVGHFVCGEKKIEARTFAKLPHHSAAVAITNEMYSVYTVNCFLISRDLDGKVHFEVTN